MASPYEGSLISPNMDDLVGKHQIVPVQDAKNLGCWFDHKLDMVTHVNKICSASYFYLNNIRCIRKFLSIELT